MRKSYYNYWTHLYGDAIPQDLDMTVAGNLYQNRHINPLFTSDPVVAHYASVLQTRPEKRKKKCSCGEGSIKILLVSVSVLLIVFLLAFVFTLTAWGIMSSGFKNAHSNVEPTTSREQTDPIATGVKYCETAGCLQLAENVLKYVDLTLNPCDGFYQYVCGRHSDEISIPDSSAKFGVHEILINQTNYKLKVLFETPPEKSDSKWKTFAKDFYRKCMDLSSIKKEALRPLKNLINLYGGWPILDDGVWTERNYSWEAVNALLINKLAIQTLMIVTVDPDSYNNSNMLITINQPGGVINVNRNPNSAAFNRQKRSLLQSAYLDGIVDLAVAFGADKSKATKQLQDVLLFETLVSNMTILDEEEEEYQQHSRTDDYNLMSMAEIKEELTMIDWDTWFSNLLPKELSISADDKVFNLAGLRYLRLLENLIAETSYKTLANYHMLNLVEAYIDYLSPVYRKYRKSQKKHYFGINSDLERWEECVMQTTEHMPWIVSAMYVQLFKDSNLKEDVELLVDNLQRSMERTLRHSPWMDRSTIDEALDKLTEMDHKIAYPGFLNNDSRILEEIQDVDISDSSYFEAVVSLTARQTNQSFMRYKFGDNFPEWPSDSPPISVNAFYRFQSNDVVLPIGLLQEPLMSSGYPKYIQYSRLGLLAGHEMSHAYDVEGSRYDKDGNLRTWWSNETMEKFSSKIDCIIKQYDNITEPITGKQLQGQKFIGESLSDNSALVLAYNAYKIWLKDNSIKEEQRLSSLASFTPFQMFFISYANMWCETVRPEAIPLLLDYEEHALSSFRVDVPLKNFREFSEEFKCQEGSPMNPSNKCQFF